MNKYINMNPSNLEKKIEALNLCLKISIHEPTVQEINQRIGYAKLLYKLKTRKDYNNDKQNLR